MHEVLSEAAEIQVSGLGSEGWARDHWRFGRLVYWKVQSIFRVTRSIFHAPECPETGRGAGGSQIRRRSVRIIGGNSTPLFPRIRGLLINVSGMDGDEFLNFCFRNFVIAEDFKPLPFPNRSVLLVGAGWDRGTRAEGQGVEND